MFFHIIKWGTRKVSHARDEKEEKQAPNIWKSNWSCFLRTNLGWWISPSKNTLKTLKPSLPEKEKKILLENTSLGVNIVKVFKVFYCFIREVRSSISIWMITEFSLLCSEEHTESICTSIYNNSVGVFCLKIRNLISSRLPGFHALLWLWQHGSIPSGTVFHALLAIQLQQA